MKIGRFLVASLALLVFAAAARGVEMKEKWVYADVNFLVDKNVDDFIALMRTAKDAGCTAMQVKDPQFGFMGLLPPEYFKNVERARKAAAEIGIKIIPGVYPFGYSGGYLVQDLNLAAGLPVRNAPFMVKNGRAAPDPASAPVLANPGFEEVSEGSLAGWTVLDAVKGHVAVDKEIKHSGASSLVMRDLGALPQETRRACRASQELKVEPFQYYHVSLWIKTDSVQAEGEDYLLITSGKRRNCYTNLGVKPTEDWTFHSVTFNTLEASSISFSIGVSSARGGTVWFDDVVIEPAGLCNVLRRPCKPLKVTSTDGSVTYVEGKDFEPVADPDLGKGDAEGQYYIPFPYYTYHKGPDIILTPDSRIKDGDKILVSFFHTHKIYNDQILVSMEDPKVLDLMEDQVRRVKEAWDPPAFMMNYDEIRICGWEEQPGGARLTPGQLLADSIRKGVEIIKKHSPNARIYTWSDMFTPRHNARRIDGPGYYLCNGDWYGSWEGLPKDVGIVIWGGGHDGLMWFADRGNSQVIAGYYDRDPVGSIRRWMTAAQGVPNVEGMMYTTWSAKYADLPAFFKALADWQPPQAPTASTESQARSITQR